MDSIHCFERNNELEILRSKILPKRIWLPRAAEQSLFLTVGDSIFFLEDRCLGFEVFELQPIHVLQSLFVRDDDWAEGFLVETFAGDWVAG